MLTKKESVEKMKEAVKMIPNAKLVLFVATVIVSLVVEVISNQQLIVAQILVIGDIIIVCINYHVSFKAFGKYFNYNQCQKNNGC